MSGFMNGWDTWDAVADPTRVGSGLMGIAGDNWFGKAGAQLFNQVVSNSANGYIDAHSLEVEDGKVVGWHFDGDQWAESVVGQNALASYVGGIVEMGVTDFVDGMINNIDLQGFDLGGQDIVRGLQRNVGKISRTIGGLVGEGVGSLIDGEFSINLLNLADLLAFLPGDKTDDMSDDFFKKLQNLKNNSSMGLFELNIGVRPDKAGIRSRIGTGGAGINIMGLVEGFVALGRIGDINAAAIEAREEQRNNESAINRQEESREENESIVEGNETEEDSIEDTQERSSLNDFVEQEQGLISGEEFKEFKESLDDLDSLPSTAAEKLWQVFYEDGGAEKKKTIDLLVELIGKDKVDLASGFMKDLVLEEGLIAYDFLHFALEAINSGEITEEKVEELAQQVDSVVTLRHKFEEVFKVAIEMDKVDLLNAISDGTNQDISDFNTKMKFMQNLGIINNHMIFNPFDQENFDQNQIDEMAARRRVIENNALAMSRMILVQEGDKQFFYIIDNRVKDDWLQRDRYEEDKNGDQSWSKLDANVYKVEVQTAGRDKGLPEGISWHNGALVIVQNSNTPTFEAQDASVWLEAMHKNSRSIFNNDNLVGKSGDSYFRENRDPNGRSLGISLEEGRMAGYVPRRKSSIVGTLSAIQDSLPNSPWLNDKNHIGGLLAARNTFGLSNIISKIRNKNISALAKQYQDLVTSQSYNHLQVLKENGYVILNSNTWCNVGAAGYAYEYYQSGMGYDNASAMSQSVAQSLSKNTLADSNAFVSVSLDYAALWGKTNALSYGRMFSTGGRPGHISMFSDIQRNSGDSSKYVEDDIYEYYFSNIGEWNGTNLNLAQVWGSYNDYSTGLRDLNRFKHKVDFFVLAPGIR
jgi:hypothetical protein